MSFAIASGASASPTPGTRSPSTSSNLSAQRRAVLGEHEEMTEELVKPYRDAGLGERVAIQAEPEAGSPSRPAAPQQRMTALARTT